MQEMGIEEENKGASEDQLSKLKEVKIDKSKHFVEKEEGKGLSPPDCSICTFEIKDKAIQLKCKHLFHKECVVEWLKINKICPVCRKDIE